MKEWLASKVSAWQRWQRAVVDGRANANQGHFAVKETCKSGCKKTQFTTKIIRVYIHEQPKTVCFAAVGKKIGTFQSVRRFLQNSNFLLFV
jgi:hypothetical protein